MNLYVDLDGTLARWNKNASLEDLLEEGYFLSLEQERSLVEWTNAAAVSGKYSITILSHYLSESRFALKEKKAWIWKNLPMVTRWILIPTDQEKGRFIVDMQGHKLCKDDILLDDFSKNLIGWEKEGGCGIKWINAVNNSMTSAFHGLRVHDVNELQQLLQERSGHKGI